MQNPKWLILTALRMEAKAVAGAFSAKFPAGSTRIQIFPKAGRSEIAHPPELVHPVELQLIAIRAACLSADIFSPMPRGVILAGLAGGLDPRLKPGDVVIDAPSECQPPGNPSSGNLPAGNPPSEISWPKLKPTDFTVHFGKIRGSDKIIGSPAEKTELFRQTGALAVDMETQILQPKCAALGIPFWCIRGISDAADQHLPADFANWIDETGQIRPGALMKEIVRKPTNIPELMRLGKASNLAVKNMARVVFEMLN